jgi:GNAT superfamily N-acetyltransferase
MTSSSGSGKVKIRKYRDTDYKVGRELWVELVQYHMDIYKTAFSSGSQMGHGFDEYLKNPDRRGTWVAESDGQVIGLGGLLVSGTEHGEVEPMVVAEKFRGKGVSRALMNRIVAEAEKAGVRFLSVRPGARNKRAISAYFKLGFKNVWTVQLIRELNPPPGRKIRWLPGLKIHDINLSY